VVGAGVAGLTIADRLARAGDEVVVLEKARVVGGLARSFRYGEFTFDIGPHRFHSYDDDVHEFITGVLGDDALVIGRSSGVFMFGRTFDWPLTLRSGLRLPPSVLLSATRDLVSRRPADGESFEDYVRARYGDTLYRVFFKPYTERFTGTPCNRMSRAWASTGLERALIDRGIPSGTLTSLIRSAVRPRESLQFLYPDSGGIGVFSDRLADRLRSASATILTDCPVTGVQATSDRIEAVLSGDRAHPCDTLVWTAPITQLGAQLGTPIDGLTFLSLALFNYRVAAPPRTQHQWCYYSDDSVPFSRVSVPTLFNPRLAPAGSHGLCVEIPMLPTDPRWPNPEALTPAIDDALVRVGLVASPSDIIGVDVERVPNAYPLYTLDYQRRLAKAKSAMSRFQNLRLLGRNATFTYNNMDGSIAAALALTRETTAAG